MTLPVTAEPLPSSYTFGKIVGRVVHLIADTAEDTDDKPQARAAAGKVHFQPKEVLRKTTDADYPAIVLHRRESANLSSSGRILDAEGRQGIWLAVGIYTVTFEIKDAARAIPDFEIEVTADYTDAAPLDLATYVPYVPPTGVVVQTLLVPAGGTEGQVLARSADGTLAWVSQSGGTGGTGAVSSVNGQTGTVVLDAADIGAQPAGSYATATQLSDGLATKVNNSTYTAGLAGKVDTTDPRLTDARTPTAHGHLIAEVTGLQGVLDGKQAAGDYATTSDVTAASTADRARANHTGTQAASTITGLATVATTGAYGDLTGRPTIPAAYTDEQAQDAAAALLTSGTHTGVTFTYDDAGNRVNATVTATGGDDFQGPPGLVWRGPWDTQASYAADDAISHSGRSFIALAPSTGVAPPTTATNSATWGLLSDRGEPGPAGAGSVGQVSPGNLGYLAWTHDPMHNTHSLALSSSGEVYGSMLFLNAGQTITGISVVLSQVGAGLTSAQLGLYDAAGNLVASTADQAAALMTGANTAKEFAFTNPYSVPSTGRYYAAILAAGTTVPRFASREAGGDATWNNVNRVDGARFSKLGNLTGQVALPATFNPATSSRLNFALWIGLY